jgi:hypothetical protein
MLIDDASGDTLAIVAHLIDGPITGAFEWQVYVPAGRRVKFTITDASDRSSSGLKCRDVGRELNGISWEPTNRRRLQRHLLLSRDPSRPNQDASGVLALV